MWNIIRQRLNIQYIKAITRMRAVTDVVFPQRVWDTRFMPEERREVFIFKKGKQKNKSMET